MELNGQLYVPVTSSLVHTVPVGFCQSEFITCALTHLFSLKAEFTVLVKTLFCLSNHDTVVSIKIV